MDTSKFKTQLCANFMALVTALHTLWVSVCGYCRPVNWLHRPEYWQKSGKLSSFRKVRLTTPCPQGAMCRYEGTCQFAHGAIELRSAADVRHCDNQSSTR